MNLNKTVRFSVGYRYDLLASPFFTIFFVKYVEALIAEAPEQLSARSFLYGPASVSDSDVVCCSLT